ncbi:hypothetical protein AAEO57_10195 [Flavobacterium sp. DGU38]|uniref:DUF1735 domain-containing protein n=1 Tax=Flavobacterium calami TaxID=3139144 RepID=A0ABU9INX5_9FLAO
MKQNQYKNSFLSFLAVCVAALAVMTSCDTEYNTVYNDIPGDITYVSGDAYIKSFTIQEHADQAPMQAAIVNDTIKIVWVSYHEMPQTIIPNIVLADKAVISPKSAVEIPFKNGQKYTVTSEAGTSRQYTLQVDFRQPQPKTFGLGTSGKLGGWIAVNGGGGAIATDNFWFNLEQTRVYLVSAADQTTEYDCEIVYFGKGTGVAPFQSYGIYFYLPTNMPVGKYDVRIKNGEYVLRQSKEANWFNYEVTESTELVFSDFNPAILTAKVGGTFNIRGTKLDTGKNIFISIGTNGTRYQLEIVSRTAYAATFKVPAGTPAGAYNRFFFVDENGAAIMKFKSFTITE